MWKMQNRHREFDGAVLVTFLDLEVGAKSHLGGGIEIFQKSGHEILIFLCGVTVVHIKYSDAVEFTRVGGEWGLRHSPKFGENGRRQDSPPRTRSRGSLRELAALRTMIPTYKFNLALVAVTRLDRKVHNVLRSPDLVGPDWLRA